jgi:hypothetical protein
MIAERFPQSRVLMRRILRGNLAGRLPGEASSVGGSDPPVDFSSPCTELNTSDPRYRTGAKSKGVATRSAPNRALEFGSWGSNTMRARKDVAGPSTKSFTGSPSASPLDPDKYKGPTPRTILSCWAHMPAKYWKKC